MQTETKEKIIELFNQGKSFSTIRWELFHQCGCKKCRAELTEKNINPFKFQDFLIIIGKSEQEYHTEFKRLYTFYYAKTRNEKTDTQPLWNTIRKKCLKRDNYRCVYCGEKAEVVHHIISYSKCQTHEFCNLISLCKLHHEQVHRSKFYEKQILSPKKMKVWSNDPCPCGSLKKYKKCCLIV